jgi:hypothetical protein
LSLHGETKNTEYNQPKSLEKAINGRTINLSLSSVVITNKNTLGDCLPESLRNPKPKKILAYYGLVCIKRLFPQETHYQPEKLNETTNCCPGAYAALE